MDNQNKDEVKKPIDFSSLYPKPKTYDEIQEKREQLDQRRYESTHDIEKPIGFMGTLVVNLVIMVPYILSFLSIAAILSYDSVYEVMKSPVDRINISLLTIPAIFPWYFAIRTLRRILRGYQVSLIALLVVYALFIAPVLDISVYLHGRNVPDIAIFAGTFVLSQLYIWSVAYTLKDNKARLFRAALPAALVLPLAIVAIIY